MLPVLFAVRRPSPCTTNDCQSHAFLDKLPVNSIFNLYQDRQGFFWLGTAYGLERYDGYDIQPFINNYKNPHKLTHNDIRCFAEDDNYLWVGTVQGINLVDKSTYQITSFPDSALQTREIRDLICDQKGNIWVAAGKNCSNATPTSVY